MGLIRKISSVSTLGAVKYTSRREAQTKHHIAEARLANAQAQQVRAENAPEIGTAGSDFSPDLPWYRQRTLGEALQARHRRE